MYIPIDPYAVRAGSRVVYHGMEDGALMHCPGCDSPKVKLTVGKTYVVSGVHVLTWQTRLWVMGADGWFPSGAFHMEPVK
jgi:hypothetical protein